MAIAVEQEPGFAGPEDIRFELSDLYQGLDDPALERDILSLTHLCEEFEKDFKGKLSQSLGKALERMQAIQRLNNKVSVFLHLTQACDAANQKIQQIVGRARESWAKASANYLTFFEQEVGLGLSEADYSRLLENDKVVKHHKSFIDHIRKCAKHLLPQEVERAILLREPFGPQEWISFMDEAEVRLTFSVRARKLKKEPFWGKKQSLTRMIDLMLYGADSDTRFESMKSLNKGLKENLAPVMARSLNVVAGQKTIEDEERGYSHPMSARNLDNRVSDEVVKALHDAVLQEGPKLTRRYFKLLAMLLGKDKLYWSDRTARPFPDQGANISWDQSFSIVRDSYHSFSPVLADIVSRMFERRWIDAAPYKGKISGAFNYSVDLPDSYGVRSYTFLNYLGSERDVMVLAHEIGHAVHGVLAAQAQGALMFRAPMVYAETASIFGEMLTFHYLLGKAENPHRKLGLYMEKCSDFVSSVVRQISFSFFEQRIHGARKEGKLTVDDLCAHWLGVTRELYGEDGDIFEYGHMEYLWSYVTHFLNPFYVYAYAFGALLTQSLFASRTQFGSSFEGMYLDLLSAGGTRDAVQLLKPFNLNPADPAFWVNGMKSSIGSWLSEAEKLVAG